MKKLREFMEEAKAIAEANAQAQVVEEEIDLDDVEDEGEEEDGEELEEGQQIDEAADVELKPHPNGTHYIVHKIHPKSGIESDQMKVGEKISDTHVDDLHDMGYNVKIHKK